jgi:hypothetical protein
MINYAILRYAVISFASNTKISSIARIALIWTDVADLIWLNQKPLRTALGTLILRRISAFLTSVKA